MTAEPLSQTPPARRSVSSTVTAALLALAVLAGAPCVVAALLAGGRTLARFDPLHAARLDPVSATPSDAHQVVRSERFNHRLTRARGARREARPARDWSRARLIESRASTTAPSPGAAWGAREALLALPPPARAA